MIQRKQSVFLLLAVVAGVICLCLPVGYAVPDGIAESSAVYNLWVANPNGGVDFTTSPLFAVQVLASSLEFVTIFLYSNRKLQISLCFIEILLQLVWMIAYVVIAASFMPDGTSFRPAFVAVLPLVALILVFMARKGVKADEALIRAADRIR